MVMVTAEGITVLEIAVTFGDKNSYLGRELILLVFAFTPQEKEALKRSFQQKLRFFVKVSYLPSDDKV